jgi:hypothetical protein
VAFSSHLLVNAWLFGARNDNSEEKVLFLLTKIRHDVVHDQDHWPCAMVVVPLIEGVHFIGAQAKPYIPWVRAEIFMLLIEVLPLSTIGRVCNHELCAHCPTMS